MASPVSGAERLALGAALAASLTGCVGFGDPSHDVTIKNDTAVLVMVYEDDKSSGRVPTRVEPGAEYRNTWLWPVTRDDRRRRTMLAEDAAGNVVFCARLSREDLEAASWVVVIRAGVSRC